MDSGIRPGVQTAHMDLPAEAVAATVLIEVVRISALPAGEGVRYPGEVVAHWTGSEVANALALIANLPGSEQHRCGFGQPLVTQARKIIERGDSSADSHRRFVELVALTHLPVGLKAERVSLEAGENMQMDMEDFLESRLAVSQEEIDSFASQAGQPQCATEPVCHRPEPHTDVVPKILQSFRM